MHCMKTLKGIQLYNKGFKNYYNFIRPHLGLNGLTPANVSGLDVPDNWSSILKRALEKFER